MLIETRLGAQPFRGTDVFLMPHKVGHRGFAAQRQINTEEPARAPARQHQRRFAQRLAGNRAGIDAGASNGCGLLDERYRTAEQTSRNGAADARRPAAKHNQIERLNAGGFRGSSLSPQPEVALEYAIRRAIGIAGRDAAQRVIGITENPLMSNGEELTTYFLAEGFTATAKASV